ncbi:hypothetical protein SBADM41S_01855 [Streptomyces badius]
MAFWATLVLLAVVATVAFLFKPMHLGDDVAAGLGVRYTTVRAVLLLCAVLLAAVAVSAAGPVPFVALVAPQVAMRLARCPTPPMVASRLVGAALIGSDLIAGQRCPSRFRSVWSPPRSRPVPRLPAGTGEPAIAGHT